MNYLFAPGCALLLYKPSLASTVHKFLMTSYGEMDMLLTCCQHIPPIPFGTTVINVCPGCDRRYREEYETPSTVSLWELLATSETFPCPDYKNEMMTIIDACPTQDQDRIHNAMRTLVSSMKIEIIEPAQTRHNSTCCGDIAYGKVPTSEVVQQMKSKAREMPVRDVIVYCVSCIKAMLVGGARPRYMIDLLFGEETDPQTYEPDAWHTELDTFIDSHREFEIADSCSQP